MGEDTTEETSEMETTLTADLIPESMPIGLLSLLGPTDQSSPFGQAGPIGLLEVLLAVPLAMDLSGKVDPDPDNLWMISLTENPLMIMPLLLLELLNKQ